ncbi:hypothetical protein D3C87_1633680 [compost metagenome]
MQLIDLGTTGDAERQWLGAFQVDGQITAKHAAAQFQANERADVGLGDAQVNVLGLHIQFGADRRQIDLAIGRELALLAHACVEPEQEGRAIEAVEFLQVEIQRPQFQCHGGLSLAVCQVYLVIA